MKVTVSRIFRDKFTKKLYPIGVELNIEDESRVNDLVSRNLVSKVEDYVESQPQSDNTPKKGRKPSKE